MSIDLERLRSTGGLDPETIEHFARPRPREVEDPGLPHFRQQLALIGFVIWLGGLLLGAIIVGAWCLLGHLPAA